MYTFFRALFSCVLCFDCLLNYLTSSPKYGFGLSHLIFCFPLHQICVSDILSAHQAHIALQIMVNSYVNETFYFIITTICDPQKRLPASNSHENGLTFLKLYRFLLPYLLLSDRFENCSFCLFGTHQNDC